VRALVAMAAGEAREARPFFIFFTILACAGVGVSLLYRGPDSHLIPNLLLAAAGTVGAILGGVSVPSGARAGAGRWLDAAPPPRGLVWVSRCLHSLALFALCWALPSVVAVLVAAPSAQWNADAAVVLLSLVGGALACLSALLIAYVSGIQGVGIIAGMWVTWAAQIGIMAAAAAAADAGPTPPIASLDPHGLGPSALHAVPYGCALLAMAVVLGGAILFAVVPPCERRQRGVRAVVYLVLCGALALAAVASIARSRW